MGTGYLWCDLPRAEISGQMIAMTLCFFKQTLDSLSVSVVRDNGALWADWSQETEQARADATRQWLAAVGYAVGTYPWGNVYAGTDPKTGDGGAGIRFGDVLAPESSTYLPARQIDGPSGR